MKFIAATLLALSAIVSAVPAHKAHAAHKRATCTNPVVHVEWRSLTQAQRNSYHQAVKCLQTKKSNISGVSAFDRYPSVHDNVFGNVHYVASFLPWHRQFLWLRLLDLKDCGYNGPTPYWDWTIDSGKLATSDIWNPTTGFGGNGNTRTSAHCVESGPYANFQVTYPSKHCLARRFNNGNVRSGVFGTMQGSQYSPSMIQNILSSPDYLSFSNDIEETPHDAVHNVLAGDMAAAFSPNDAMFWLHHQQIDRLWAKWQSANATRLQEYGGNTVQGQEQTDGSRFPLAKIADILPMQNIRGMPDVRVASVMDTKSDSLCYVYDK
ncbi:Di-copper centre-containing protein [Ceratobasidium sp. AG-I]|nr:Di-copper centre-containing protein [Ceratobasidium sp. AG-I]